MTVRQVSRLSNLPHGKKFWAWDDSGPMAPHLKKFKELFNIDPSIVYVFGSIHYVETNILVSV